MKRLKKQRRQIAMRRLLTALYTTAFVAATKPAYAQLSSDAITRIERAIESGDTGRIKKALDALPKSLRSDLVRSLRMDIQVIGGSPVRTEEFPWQVALVQGARTEPVRVQFCGGTIIAPDLVITAAHCVDSATVRKDAALVNIVAGATAYERGGQRLKVKQILVHPKWNAKAVDFDVALLRLTSPLQLGHPIALTAVAPLPESRAWVSGWGATVEGGGGSPYLRSAVVPIVARSICNGPDAYNGAITHQMFCAGQSEGGKDSCQGDSGGPLVAGPRMHERLVGIVSKGVGCGRPGKYGIYTDVASIADWVRQETGLSPKSPNSSAGDDLFTLPTPISYPDR